MTNNTKHNKLIQSAGNFIGSSETTRQLSDNLELKIKKDFISWFAGIIDGDGNFDLRKHPVNKHLILKAIRIKLHKRDVRILTRIQNTLHIGRIRYDKNKPHVLYIISIRKHMEFVIKILNGLILIKVESFKKACFYLNIDFKKGNYSISPLDNYFAGLIDSDGSIVFNSVANRIECNLELKYTEYTKNLCLNNVIPNYKPSVLLREKKITGKPGKTYKSIAFKFQTVSGMIFLYRAFMKIRLYCDFKFYRVSSIKKFLLIRHYRKYDKNSLEFQIYLDFVLDWVKHLNPLWVKVPFVIKLLNEKNKKQI